MSRSNLSDPFYATVAVAPRDIDGWSGGPMLCGFCLEPVAVTASLAFFPMTGMTLVYRRSVYGRLLITCDDGCHPLLSLGLDRPDMVEVGRHTYPPVMSTCERCRTAIDRRRWRQLDRQVALGLMREGVRFRSYDEALGWVAGEHEMLRAHRMSVLGKD